jgi:hypothetical protein
MKHLIIFLLFTLLTVFLPFSSWALTPTPTPQPNVANCDVCGYCQDTKAALEERWTNDLKRQGKTDQEIQNKIQEEWQRWVENWEKCRNCLYPALTTYPVEQNKTLEGLPTPNPNRHYTMLGCIAVPGTREDGSFDYESMGLFIRQISGFFFNIVGGIAFLFLLYGAGIMATSQSDPEKLNQGKRIIYGAIVGLLFVLFSAFIFNFIAVEVLKIPGFGQ